MMMVMFVAIFNNKKGAHNLERNNEDTHSSHWEKCCTGRVIRDL